MCTFPVNNKHYYVEFIESNSEFHRGVSIPKQPSSKPPRHTDYTRSTPEKLPNMIGLPRAEDARARVRAFRSGATRDQSCRDRGRCASAPQLPVSAQPCATDRATAVSRLRLNGFACHVHRYRDTDVTRGGGGGNET